MSAVSSPRRAAPRRAAPVRSPRRLSGPVGGRAALRTSPQPAPTVGARALAVVRSLPHHSLVDRLVRGRAWIPVLGALLAGIVAMQVEILKLGTTLGRSLERTTALQSQNESLQARVATLADDQRIERLAAAMGMAMPSPDLLTFLPARPQGQLGKAIANIHSPDATGFASQLAAQIASAMLIAPSAPSAATGTTQTSTTAGASGAAGSTSATPTAPAGAGAAGTTAGSGSTGATGTSTPATGTAAGTPAGGAAAAATGPTTSAATTPAATPPGPIPPTGAAGLPSTATSQGSTGG